MFELRETLEQICETIEIGWDGLNREFGDFPVGSRFVIREAHFDSSVSVWRDLESA